MDELYLENIDELIADHNKIVTYKWLSHTLGVHVNQAKQMLYDYVTRKRKENASAQVHVTYLVTGRCTQDGYPYHKVAVVREEQLEAAKSKLALVANVHVYSIQKAALKDSAPLFSTDYDIIKNNLHNCSKFSAIQCAAAVPRSAEEIAQLQRNHQETEEVTVPSKPKVNGQAAPPAAKSQQPKGIMGMFSRPAAKSQESKPAAVEPARDTAPETSTKSSAKSSSTDNFFGKASLSKRKETASTNDSVKAEKPAEQPIEVPPPVKEADAPKAGTKEKKSRNKRAEMSDDDEPDKLAKKRRRIKQQRQDSSDEDDAMASFSREVKTPSPPPPPPPPEPEVKMETESEAQSQPGEKRRKRKRVLKSKTFLDAEGCMVTEKLYESESCTDSGEEFTSSRPAASKPSVSNKAEPKAETKTSKKAPAASKGTKQPSIMGFFQKK